MIDSVWLNISSLVFGIIAWTLPVVNLLQNNKQENQKWVIYSVMSMGACAISLCFQMIAVYHLVLIEDWSALLDIMGFLTFVATILLIITIILNAITFIVYRNRKQTV